MTGWEFWKPFKRTNTVEGPKKVEKINTIRQTFDVRDVEKMFFLPFKGDLLIEDDGLVLGKMARCLPQKTILVERYESKPLRHH